MVKIHMHNIKYFMVFVYAVLHGVVGLPGNGTCSRLVIRSSFLVAVFEQRLVALAH